MMGRFRLHSFAAIVVAAAALHAPVADSAAADTNRPDARTAAPAIPGAPSPVWFESNRGQAGPDTRVVARSAGLVALLTDDGAVVGGAAGPDAGAFALRFTGAASGGAARGSVRPVEALPGRSNYLIGDDPTKWLRGVPHYAGAVLGDALPGIDVRWRGDGRDLRFDVEVAPFVAASDLRVRIDGADRAAIDGAGRLVVDVRGVRTEISAPVAWQERRGRRDGVTARWAALDDGTFGFSVSGRDPAAALVIDPSLHAATFLGASKADQGYAIATDTSGAIFLAGSTLSSAFPAQPTSGTGAVVQPVYSEPSTSAFYETRTDGFVAKLAADTKTISWCTFLGGNDNDAVAGIALDANGAVVVCGSTSATNFPTKFGALATSGAGFLSTLAYDGTSLTTSTYLTRAARRVAVDASGNLVVLSEGSPAQVAAYNSIATSASWSNTFTPPSGSLIGRGLVLDGSGNAWVAGATSANSATLFPSSSTSGYLAPYDSSYNGGTNDVLIWKCDASNGGTRVFVTYLGGGGDDQAEDLAIDASGAICVCGTTTSTTVFPTTGGFQTTNRGGGDGFLTRLNAPTSTATTLSWSTYFGGNLSDAPRALAVNAASDIYLAGDTTSTTNFPLSGAIQGSNAGGTDGFMAKVSSAGALKWSTYVGGTAADTVTDLVVGPTGRPAATGQTVSAGFPTKTPVQPANAGAGDAYVWIAEESTTPFGSVTAWDLSTDTSFGDATEGVAWNVAGTALPLSGGRAPVMWALSSGSLPAGLSLSNIGVVSGTPAAGSAGAYRFWCRASDFDGAVVVREYSLTVFGPPRIATSALPGWTIERIMDTAIASTGGRPPLTWSLASGSTLPEGLSLDGSQGRVQGGTTVPGDYSFSVRLTDANGSFDERTVTFRMNDRPTVDDVVLAPWTETSAYAKTFTGSQGTVPYRWSVTAGTAPVAATIEPATGRLAGNVLAAGDYDFVVQLKDAAGAVATRAFQMHVNRLPTVATTVLPVALAARPYRGQLESGEGTGGRVWFLTGEGAVPVGFLIDGPTGAVSGTPLLARDFSFEVRVQDDCGASAKGFVQMSVLPFFSLAERKNAAVDAFGPDAQQGPVTRYIELLAGSRLDGSIRLVGKGKLGAHLRLVDADTGTDVDLTGYVKTRGTKTTLSKFVVDQDRRFLLVVEPDAGFVGTVETQLAARAQASWSGTVTVDPAGAAVPVTLSAMAGAKLTVTVNRAKHSRALPTITSVVDEHGAELLDVVELKATRTGAVLRMTKALPVGRLTISFAGLPAGPAGACAWKATLKNPKGYTVAFYDRPAGL